MQLAADESVDFGLIVNLRSIGFEVLSIAEFSPGIDDMQVMAITVDKNCLLITEDKDFGELVHRLKMEHNGILLIRMNEINREDRLKIIPSMIKEYFSKLKNNFSVLTSNGLRIRK